MKNNENGFTLIEMMIVMLIISVLLIITIPNIAKHNETINDKGCQAFVRMVEAQVQAYEMDNNKIPTIQELVDAKYLKNTNCPDGKTQVKVETDGTVVEIAVASGN